MRNPVVAEDLEAISRQPVPWERLRGRTVLVTGAAGFLPAYLVDAMLTRNDLGQGEPTRVLGLVRDAGRANARFADHAGRRDFELVVQDVCAPPRVHEQVHVVIHAASQASPRYYASDPVGTALPNVVGTHQLLEFARSQGVEAFLYFSSSEVYGEIPAERQPIAESALGTLDPMNVRSCYGESKRMGETLCVSYWKQYGVPVKVVRPFHTYGPGMRLDDGRVFADFVASVVARRPLVLKSDGSARRAFCYLSDATAGFLMAMLLGEPGTAYNVGNEHAELSIRELAELLVAGFPDRALRVEHGAAPAAGYVPSTVSRSCPDTARLRTLGWRPTTQALEGFRRTVRSFE